MNKQYIHPQMTVKRLGSSVLMTASGAENVYNQYTDQPALGKKNEAFPTFPSVWDSEEE